jgi:hypothetical protein
LTRENLEDSPQVTVSALLMSGSRNDAALEQIIGRMSLSHLSPPLTGKLNRLRLRTDIAGEKDPPAAAKRCFAVGGLDIL